VVEKEINRWKLTIARLEAIIENEDLSLTQAKSLRQQYELAHWMLDQLTGEKGDKRPNE